MRRRTSSSPAAQAGPWRRWFAVLIGLYAWRRPPSPAGLFWLVAACLGMRCIFEAVMTPYYLVPPLILAMAAASIRPTRHFLAAVLIALETTVFAYHYLSPWAWWLPVVAGTIAVLALGYPGRAAFDPRPIRAGDLRFRSRMEAAGPSLGERREDEHATHADLAGCTVPTG